MVHILTSSSCDLTPAQIEALHVTMIPDMIAFGPDEQYRNNIEIDAPGLYRRLGPPRLCPAAPRCCACA